MISDEERREVAERLRNASARRCDTPWMVEDLMLALGFRCYEDGEDRLFDRLADLIEPAPERTCHPVIEDETAVCSECGEDIDGYGWTYCPNCGAKVAGEPASRAVTQQR